MRSSTRIRFGSLDFIRPHLHAPTTNPMPTQGRIKSLMVDIAAIVVHEILATPGPLAKFAPRTRSRVGIQQLESIDIASPTRDPHMRSFKNGDCPIITPSTAAMTEGVMIELKAFAAVAVGLSRKLTIGNWRSEAEMLAIRT